MIKRTRAALVLLESKWSVDIIILVVSGMHRPARPVDNMPASQRRS
jgi:hypothetical protein